MSRAMVVLDTEFQRRKAAEWCWAAKNGSRVEFKGPKRSLDQNSLMWVLLTEIAVHMRKTAGLEYSTEEWKHIFLHGWGREVRFLPALDGKGVVPIPQSSSDLSKEEMTDFIEYILKEGAERGVQFESHPSQIEPPAGETIRATQDGAMDPEPTTGQSPVGSGSHLSAAREVEPGAERPEAGHVAAAEPAPGDLDEREWLKGFARAVAAAIHVDEEFVVATSKGMFVEGLSDDTRERARTITNHARAVCRSEMERSDALAMIANKARCEQKELSA